VTTIALEMVVPGVIGLWIDRQLGTVLVFLVLGVALGMTTGVIHLVRLATPSDRGESRDRKSPDEDSS
jgi:F0F1-type ATP synthase assembly protein I